MPWIFFSHLIDRKGNSTINFPRECFLKRSISFKLKYLLISIIGVACLAFFSYVFLIGLFSAELKPIPILGNRKSNISRLPSPYSDKPFTFAVIGDTQGGSEIFKRLMKISQQEKATFIIICGDFIRKPKPTPGAYRYFLTNFKDLHMSIPTFLVIGNHEIGKGPKNGEKIFESLFGPKNFWFVFRNSLFIILDNSSRKFDPEQYQWLKNILKSYDRKNRKKFIFMHCPTVVNYNGELISSQNTDYLKLHQLVKEYHIDYVVSSHFHGYYRTKRDNCVYLVTGGGGAKLRGKNQFHHIVKFTVEENSITS
jgi:predicted MPP superfamily phosphohydrolase